ncbi:cytochrome P450 [Streptomyces sp. NPDC005931]|uniref:cytochrome P450 n=1 Tax=Streptomyces sp. NPDC005931 TaxID=3364737 RepID=UPI003688BEE6
MTGILRSPVEEPAEWPMVRTDPYSPPDAYAELRQGPPVKVRIRTGEAWLVTRYEDVRRVLTDERFSSDDTLPGFPVRIQLPPAPRVMSFTRMDGEEHNRLRRMVMPEFTARATRRLRPQVEALVDRLLDELAEGPRPVDLVARLSLRLPSLVIARMLGVPESDEVDFTDLSQAVLSQDASPEEILAAFVRMTEYLDGLITAKLNRPADDLLSRLATQYLATGELSREDLVAMARLLLVAGHETTAHQLSLSVAVLLRHPEQLADLRRDPSLFGSAVEELLRYWSITQDNQVRVAVADTEVGGVRIPRGAGVILAYPSANHDEAVFADGGRFDIRREDASRHIAFGHGRHLCPGAPLARMELELCLRALFERFPALRLADVPEPVVFRQNTINYGLTALHVTW